MSIFGSIGNAVSGAWNDATSWVAKNIFGDKGGTTHVSSPSYSTPVPNLSMPDDSGWQAQLNAQIRSLQAAAAQTPKLPSFDILGNYNNAVAQATSAVNPLYQQKLDNYLATESTTKANETAAEANIEAGNNLTLAQTTKQANTNIARAGEDLTTGLTQIGTQEGQFQDDDAAAFDQSRRQLASSVVGAGLGASGLGAAQGTNATNARNTASGRQEQTFTDARTAARTTAGRTTEDQTTAIGNAGDLNVNQNKAAQIDLQGTMDKLAGDERDFRLSNEASRLGDIVTQTGQYQQQGVAQFLSSLAAGVAKGTVRPQDYALAAATYKV